MKTYKVQFKFRSGGFIDGYRTARRAKEVVAKVNAAATGCVASYLGKEG